LGGLYDNGCAPLHKDYKKAVYWLRKAAEQGSREAEFGLGVAYALGQGVPQDFNRADFWLMKAVHKGSSEAAYSLGSIYFRGLGVSKNLAKSFYWYHQSALLGSAMGAERTGVAYRYGLGVKKNDTKALYWWKKAAKESGNGRKLAISKILLSAAHYTSSQNFYTITSQNYLLYAVKYAPVFAVDLATQYEYGPPFLQNQSKANYWWSVFANQYLHLLSTWPLNVLKPYILATIGWGPILFFHNTASDIGFGIPLLLSGALIIWKRKSLYRTMHWVIPGFFIAFALNYLFCTKISSGLTTPWYITFILPYIWSLIVIISRLRFSWLLSYPMSFFAMLLGTDIVKNLQLLHFDFHTYWYMGVGGASYADDLFDGPLLALFYALVTMWAVKAIIRYRNRRSPQVSS
jgi:hypothetical protein